MKITYECEHDNWTEFFTEQILKAANVEAQEIHVIATDESRTYIKVKIWNADAAPTIMGMAKGAWEEHTWVIKRELEEIDTAKYKNLDKVGTIFKDYGFAKIQEMQVGKQADTIMLFQLLRDMFSDEEIKFLSDAISTHMGPWITDYNGNEVLPYPKTKYQNFVHMCDFLASKKFLNIEFDENNNIVE